MKTIPKVINRAELKSTDQLRDLMQDVIKKAKAKGATESSVAVNHDLGFEINVRMGDVETVAFNEDNGVGLTVYIGHAKGSASSSDTSPKAIDAMVNAAIEIAKVSAKDPCFGLPDKELMSNIHPNLDLYHPWNISPQNAIEKALECEKHALKFDKRIINSDGVNLSTHTYCSGHATSQGFLDILHTSRHGVSCSLIAKDKHGMQRDYDYTTARDPSLLLPLDVLAESAAARVTARLGAKKLKTQKAPVVFSSRLSSGIFSLLIQAISGGNLYRKNSFLLDAIGRQIFPENIEVYERPHLLGALGSAPYDAEGVPTRNNVLIKHGVLNQYVLGSYSARKMGLKTTANSGGVFNLTVDATASDLDDVLKKMGTGLLVTELMGSGVNILTGDYSRGAVGFWIEDGKIKYPVEEITIASNLNDMFKNILAIGSDRNPNSSTFCGSILVKEMMIGGE